MVQEADSQRAEIRIAKTALVNVSLWFICWTPYAVISLQVCPNLPRLSYVTLKCFNVTVTRSQCNKRAFC